jgi:hypothetical protein
VIQLQSESDILTNRNADLAAVLEHDCSQSNEVKKLEQEYAALQNRAAALEKSVVETQAKSAAQKSRFKAELRKCMEFINVQSDSNVRLEKLKKAQDAVVRSLQLEIRQLHANSFKRYVQFRCKCGTKWGENLFFVSECCGLIGFTPMVCLWPSGDLHEWAVDLFVPLIHNYRCDHFPCAPHSPFTEPRPSVMQSVSIPGILFCRATIRCQLHHVQRWTCFTCDIFRSHKARGVMLLRV